MSLVTYRGLPELSEDDRLVATALSARGVAAVPAVWDDDRVDWTAFDGVVIRSCWDYHLKPAAFLDWVGGLEREGVATWNAPATLRWNADKRYLRELAVRGVAVVPTAWVEQGDPTPLAELLREQHWERAVVKPLISASAHQTWSTDRASSARDEARFRTLTARGPAIVQPFVESVVVDGEWSLIFIRREYSHAVLKRPGDGDFRVQTEHGGSAVRADPGAALIAAAHDVLAAAGPMADGALYARVDGCVVDGGFVLMELELIEPALFLGMAPGAADRMAVSVLERLQRR